MPEAPRSLIAGMEKMLRDMEAAKSKDPSVEKEKGFNDLEQSIKDELDEVKRQSKEQTDFLKNEAKDNKTFNKMQIAETLISKRGNILKGRLEGDFYKEQRKHNKGARDSRIRVEQGIGALLKKIDDINAGRGGGGTGGQTVIVKDERSAPRTATSTAQTTPNVSSNGTVPVQGELFGRDPNAPSIPRKVPVNQTQAQRQVNKRQQELPLSGGSNAPRRSRTYDPNNPSEALRERSYAVDPTDAKKELRGEKGDLEGNVNQNQMSKLLIGGQATVRREQYKTKTGKDATRYRNEITGRLSKEDDFLESESRVENFISAVKDARGEDVIGAGETSNQLAFRTAKGSSSLAKNITANAATLQQLMESDPEGKVGEKIGGLTQLMNKAQTATGKDQEVAVKEVNNMIKELRVESQIAKESGVEGAPDFESLLGLKDLQKDLGKKTFTGSLKESLNIDQGAGFFGGLKQAFSPTRLFGDAGTGGLSNFYTDNQREEMAQREIRIQTGAEIQTRGLADMVGDEKGLSLTTPEGANPDNEFLRTDSSGRPQLNVAALEGATDAVAEGETTGQRELPLTGGGGKAKASGSVFSGTDRESFQEKSYEELVKIRELLEDGALGGDGDGGGGMDIMGRTGGKNKKGKKGKGKKGKLSRLGNMFKGKGAMLTKAGGAVAAVGLGAYTAYSGSKQAEADADAGKLTAEEEQIAKAEAVGEGVGGAGGALAGAAAGAAIGSAIPVVGTVVGGLIGGAIGYFGGSFAGKKLGGAVGDALDVDPGELAESNAQAEEAMKQIAEKDSGLASKIQQEANEIEAALLEEAGDAELSDNDKAAIKNAAIVKALMNNEAATSAIGVDRKKIADTLEANTEAGFKSAKESGLYKERGMRKSKIDRSKLGDASIDELQAIVQDDDLSADDMKAVQDALNQKKTGKAQVAGLDPVPTGDAVENMTSIEQQTGQMAGMQGGGQTVVNNVTNNTGSEGDIIVTAPPTSRINDNTPLHFQRRQYIGRRI